MLRFMAKRILRLSFRSMSCYLWTVEVLGLDGVQLHMVLLRKAPTRLEAVILPESRALAGVVLAFEHAVRTGSGAIVLISELR